MVKETQREMDGKGDIERGGKGDTERGGIGDTERERW